MVPHEAPSDNALRLERAIAAPPERVFDAWVTAQGLSRWFAPSDDYVCDVTALDPRVGGRWRVVMKHRGGNTHTVGGAYEIVDRPNRLSFSFQWEDGTAPGEMRVTLDFVRDGAGTRLVLVHERCASADSRVAHEKGWTGSLARLVAQMSVEAR